MEVLGGWMDFDELLKQARDIEDSAGEKKASPYKVSITRTIEYSPDDYAEKEYGDILNEYERLVKIQSILSNVGRSTITLPIIGAPAPTKPSPKPGLLPKIIKPAEKKTVEKPEPVKAKKPEPVPKAEKPKEEVPEIKPAEEPVVEKQEFDFDFEPEPEAKEEPEAKIEIEEKPEFELDFEKAQPEPPQTPPKFIPPEKAPIPELPELPPMEKLEIEKEMEKKQEFPAQEPLPSTPLESEQPKPFAVPPLLSMEPEKAAEKKYAEIESQIPAQPVKMNENELKKRMVTLTRELFREKATSKKQKLKEEITNIRNMLGKKSELPKRKAVSYATSFFNAMEGNQRTELAAAKENITKQYKEQFTPALSSFSSTVASAKDENEKQLAYESLQSSLQSIRENAKSAIERYQSFFIKEHTAELQKLLSTATEKKDTYVTEKIKERLEEIKFTYSSEFSALGEAIEKEISNVLNSRKHEIAEGSRTDEMEKVLSITNTSDDDVLKYVHSHYREKYYEFERGLMTKIELVVLGRTLMAKDAGLKKETINKYFGKI
ncbi:hypothetical protein KJ780_05120 [Candidatus Micrarchaeota archaeon]|nr:hypothetical protein [Candidatus Micrarchaeota archaeon]